MTKTKRPVGRPRKYENKVARQKAWRDRHHNMSAKLQDIIHKQAVELDQLRKEVETLNAKNLELEAGNISSGFSLNPDDLVL